MFIFLVCNIKAEYKIVIPYSHQNDVLKLCHDESRHLGKKKTLDKIRSRWWWSSMRKDAGVYSIGCTTCQKVNNRTTLSYINFTLCERPIPEVPFKVVFTYHLSLTPNTAVHFGTYFPCIPLCYSKTYSNNLIRWNNLFSRV